MKVKVLTFVKVLVEPKTTGEVDDKYLLESARNMLYPEVVGVGSIVGHDYVVKMSKRANTDVIVNERDSSSKFVWECKRGVFMRGNVAPDGVY